MLNWLKKALAPETGSRPAETAKPVAEKPATPLVAATTPLAKEKEKPLKAPSKILDDSTEDNSTGLLARQAIMNREHRADRELVLTGRGWLAGYCDQTWVEFL